jgi:hypothetical protein
MEGYLEFCTSEDVSNVRGSFVDVCERADFEGMWLMRFDGEGVV